LPNILYSIYMGFYIYLDIFKTLLGVMNDGPPLS
jgi:hypothetical protein